MISGSRRTGSRGSARIRSLALGKARFSANTSTPPHTSINSLTQAIPVINGSYHSSKYTRGTLLAGTAVVDRDLDTATQGIGIALRLVVHTHVATQADDHIQNTLDRPLVEADHV